MYSFTSPKGNLGTMDGWSIVENRRMVRLILLQRMVRTLEEYLVRDGIQPCVPKYRVVVQPLGGVVCFAA